MYNSLIIRQIKFRKSGFGEIVNKNYISLK